MQAPQQAPDLQAPRPVFNHKKTLSAHIREEAELKYGITGPLGNSMSVRGRVLVREKFAASKLDRKPCVIEAFTGMTSRR